jgi:hypothetical protein
MFVVEIKRLYHFEQKLNTLDYVILGCVPYQVELHSFHKCNKLRTHYQSCFTDNLVLYLG